MNYKSYRLATLLFILSLVSLAPLTSNAALQCFDCHGTKKDHDYRPVDAPMAEPFRNPSGGGFQGNHRSHMGESAVQSTCAKCHPGSETYSASHRDGTIKVSSNINSSAHPDKAVYNGVTSAWLQTANPVSGTCTNVNCHFEAGTPVWGGAPLTAPNQCNTCHGAPPADGSHPASSGSGKKHGDYYGLTTLSCAKCHVDHLAEGNNFAHATSAGKRPLKVPFAYFPYNGAYYDGNVTYPRYLPSFYSQNPTAKRDGACANYCHSNAAGGPANLPPPTWSDTKKTTCYSCHKGRSFRPDTPQVYDNTSTNCRAILGVWSSNGIRQYCTPDLVMKSNGHHRLVGGQWIRRYPCYYCHYKTVASDGTLTNLSSMAKHVNGKADVVLAPKWAMANRSSQSYDPATKTCSNTYCHSDGTYEPEKVRPYAWTEGKTDCNSCHGHRTGTCSNTGCHDGKVHADDPTHKLWTLPAQYGNEGSYHWPVGQEWMGALPMFPNQGPLSNRPNSHPRHAQTDFTCDNCHAKTVASGTCSDCHKNGIPSGGMGEAAHVNATFHVDRFKNVDFKNPEATYKKTDNGMECSNTLCHTSGTNPIWGAEINSVTCLSCHGISGPDVNDFNAFNGTQGKINLTQWANTGHGRYSSAIDPQTGQPYGSYPKSRNPAANFPGNPCWYCHDNGVLHKDPANPFRLKQHVQYEQRFLKECLYCHMERTNSECLSCHVGQTESLSPQATVNGIVYKYKFKNLSTRVDHTDHTYVTNCIDSCHATDSSIHNTNAGLWTLDMKKDVKNQYMMMGVCLQCHDDDSGGQCNGCHVSPPENPNKYALGYDPGTGYIKPKKARASAGHFGYKHYRDFTNSGGWLKHYTSVKSPVFGTYSVVSGTWKGGKFCWDCHDPHGDSNIYMIHDQVATTTDGIFGVPKTRSPVVFTDNAKGFNYAVKSAQGAVFNGICNVCHSPASKHFTSETGDGHNINRRCTICHQHRFSDSHADNQACNSCHASSKPIPKHSAFGLPRDCTKCHSGTVGPIGLQRMDIMGQLNSNSHHIQGVAANNKHCYACHWEATPEGLIDVRYHTGYNYVNYSSVKGDVVDLVLYGAGVRPTTYQLGVTAVQFLASNIGTGSERTDVGKITNHCLSCHSDQNNNTDPFGDCKTPRIYAWDQQSIDARYSQIGTATWGKYAGTANAAKKNITKSFSAHGKATLNGGGFKNTSGLDGSIPNTRAGTGNKDVQCFDCHNSHGSKLPGTTSSYATFNGTKNGANLKETQAGVGGYTYKYQASSNTSGINPYGEGAGQCFDCHNSPTSGTTVPNGSTPWGYSSTFGATSPIMGYKDTPRFGTPATDADMKPSTKRWAERYSRKTILGGHLQASVPYGLPHLAKVSSSATGGSATTLTDSSQNWVGTAYDYAAATISTGGMLYNPWLQASQNTRRPTSGLWSPPGGGTFSRIHVNFIARIGNSEYTNNDHLKVYNASNTLLLDLTNSYDGWIDIAPTTGIYTILTTYSTGQYCTYGDVPEVIVKGTATPTNKWANFYVLMTGGSNNGQLRKIISNTATTLTFEPFNSSVNPGDTYQIVPYSTPINGLCTPCHDPHGVSPTLGSNQAYALPLLKGTWMTSPYKEDAPPPPFRLATR